MKKIIFGTLNRNGGGASHNRQVQVKSLFDRKHIDVLLLQETHITEDVLMIGVASLRDSASLVICLLLLVWPFYSDLG